MADSNYKLIDIADQSSLTMLVKDVGSSMHAQAVVPVDLTGAAVDPSGFISQVTPTISASPDYSALDVAAGIITFANVAGVSGRPVVIDSLVVTDKAGQMPQFTLLLFKATPAGGIYTDNGGLTLGSGDLANFVGHVKVVTGDYYTPVSGAAVATISAIGLKASVAATSLFGLIIVDATWNAGSTSDIILTLGGRRL